MTTFLTCFSKGERCKYAEKEVRLNPVLNSQPPGHESDTLTTQPPWWGTKVLEFNAVSLYGKKKSLWERPQCFDFFLWFSIDVLALVWGFLPNFKLHCSAGN